MPDNPLPPLPEGRIIYHRAMEVMQTTRSYKGYVTRGALSSGRVCPVSTRHAPRPRAWNVTTNS
jgi:hypothetical protein